MTPIRFLFIDTFTNDDASSPQTINCQTPVLVKKTKQKKRGHRGVYQNFRNHLANPLTNIFLRWGCGYNWIPSSSRDVNHLLTQVHGDELYSHRNSTTLKWMKGRRRMDGGIPQTKERLRVSREGCCPLLAAHQCWLADTSTQLILCIHFNLNMTIWPLNHKLSPELKSKSSNSFFLFLKKWNLEKCVLTL